MKLLGFVMCACLLTACSEPAAVIQTRQARIQADINVACGVVNNAMILAAPFAVVPQVGAVMLYGEASCGTTEAIAALTTKALSDPNTIVWVQNLGKTIADSPKHI